MNTQSQETAQPHPQVKGGVIAYLQLEGAAKAAEFYGKAFGAETAFAYPPDESGRTMHVHLFVNGSSVMLSDPFPEHGCGLQSPQGFSLLLAVDDVDRWWKRAVDAGCEGVMPPADMFWGDRYAQVKDPYGFVWGMNQPKRI